MPLLIDILRHGAAEPSGPDGDGTRALSPAGIAQVRALAARLASSGRIPDRIFSSPYRRAVETARLVHAALPAPVPLETLTELRPDAEPEDLTVTLRTLAAGGGHLLLVSHMPLVSRLCSHLAGRSIAFGTAELARLECAAGIARGAARLREIPAP